MTAAVPGGVAAQSAPATASAATTGQSGDEIVVTARRREEALIDVPISVTAISGEALARTGITDIRDLQYRVPSLQVTTNTASRNTVSFAMRGQRVHEYNLLTDPAINTYFAEVVQPRTYGFGYTLFDLASVQVLKGVQGTLFGRNATGGAVLIEPNKPSHDPEGEARLMVGRFGLISPYFMLNLPLGDVAAGRVAAEYRKRGGFTRDIRNDRKLDDIEYFAGRASLLIEPNSSFSSNTIVDHLTSNNNGSSSILAILRQTGTPTSTASRYGTRLADLFIQQQAVGPRRVLGTLIDGSNAATNPFPGEATYDRLRNTGVTNRTVLSFGDISVKNIIGFRSINYRRIGDFYFVPVILLGAKLSTDIDQISEELQLQGSFLNGRLDITTGAYYFEEKGREIAASAQFPDITPPLSGSAASKVSTNVGDGRYTSYAAYMAGNFAITETVKASGGIRWTKDERLAAVSSFTAAGACRLQTDAGTLLPADSLCRFENQNRTSAVTWDASLQYEPNRDTTLYLATRKGYRAGGFNLRARSPAQLRPFLPEHVQEYELGAKRRWRLGDAVLTTNGALFLQDYSNIQTSTVALVDGRLVGVISNTAQQKNYGVELEGSLDAGPLTLSAYYSYVDISDVRGSSGDFRMRGIPHHSAGISGRYEVALGEGFGDLALSGNAAYRSSMPMDDFDVQSRQPGYALFDARIDWNDLAWRGLSVGVYVNNLTNKLFRVGETSLLDSVGLTSTVYGEPQTYGVVVRQRF